MVGLRTRPFRYESGSESPDSGSGVRVRIPRVVADSTDDQGCDFNGKSRHPADEHRLSLRVLPQVLVQPHLARALVYYMVRAAFLTRPSSIKSAGLVVVQAARRRCRRN